MNEKIYKYAKGMAINFGSVDEDCHIYNSNGFTIKYDEPADILEVLRGNELLFSGSKNINSWFCFHSDWVTDFCDVCGIER